METKNRGRPPLPPEVRAQRQASISMLAARVGLDVKRAAMMQANIEGRTLGKLLEDAVRLYVRTYARGATNDLTI